MIRFLKYFASVTIALTLITALLPLLIQPEKKLVREIVIEAPEAAIWGILNNHNEYPVWTSTVASCTYPVNGIKGQREIVWNFKGNKYILQESIHIEKYQREIRFKPDIRKINTNIRDITYNYALDRLPDGSTQVATTLSFYLQPPISQMIYYLKYHSGLGDLLGKYLTDLKQSVEKQ